MFKSGVLNVSRFLYFGKYSKDQITDYIKDLSFQLSPHSFFQVNPEQTTVLYDTALEFADLKGHETVIDA